MPITQNIMLRVGRWFDRGRVHQSSSSQSLDALAESQNLITALKAVELIMDDDLEGAEAGLAQGHSAFHALCKGVLGFLRATLGFEQDVMKEASEQLQAAETSAYNDHYKAQHASRAFASNIYETGAEFSLCQAMAQIMSCVVGVLNESLTESIRGIYKLRKAYWTLDSLMRMEQAAARSRSTQSLSRPESRDSGQSKPRQLESMREAIPEEARIIPPSSLRQAQATSQLPDDDSDDSDEFYEVNDIDEGSEVTKQYTGNLETDSMPNKTNHVLDPAEAAAEKVSGLSLADSVRPSSAVSSQETLYTNYSLLTADPDDPIFESPLDSFIHSGTNLCFGLISLLISIIPPAFSKLLLLIGFRGDRQKGIRMLWQASKFANINGAMAGLIILGWYNNLIGLCDIISDPDPEGIEGYPVHRLKTLLVEMRQRYPKSHFWIIEEARMAASARNIDRSLEILCAPRPKSQLKQLQALGTFERSMTAMHAHRYQLCSDSFMLCVDLNNWSQALYYYIAGSAHVQMYRDTKDDPSRSAWAAKNKKIAEEYFLIAPTKTGRKKVMGRQLPFDVFVTRKIAKWTARSEARQIPLVDAVGVSPVEEMILLWNGYKKMSSSQLHDSLKNLAWSDDQSRNPGWAQEDIDEKCVLAVLRANVYRNLRRHKESRRLLRSEVLGVDKHLLKGGHKDDWALPCAHYEMAVNLWMERSAYIKANGRTIAANADDSNATTANTEQNANGAPSGIEMSQEKGEEVKIDIEADRKLVAMAKGEIEKVRNWEKYDLDARIGMKVTAAWDAIKKWEAKHGAV